MSDKIFFTLVLVCAILSFIIFSSIAGDEPDEIPSESVNHEVIDDGYSDNIDMVLDEEGYADVEDGYPEEHVPIPSGGGPSASSESGESTASPNMLSDMPSTRDDEEEGPLSLIITNLVKSYTSRKVSNESGNSLVIRIIS